MSLVRFAMLCDKCGERSPEYSSWLHCEACLDDVCLACCKTPGFIRDDESGTAVCAVCALLDIEDAERCAEDHT